MPTPMTEEDFDNLQRRGEDTFGATCAREYEVQLSVIRRARNEVGPELADEAEDMMNDIMDEFPDMAF